MPALFTRAPCLKSSLATERFPLLHASCSGDQPALSWVLGSAPILSSFLTMATLPLIAEQCSGVSPRWFLLLTFLISLSSCGVLSCDLTPGPLLPELFNTPRGVLGGLVMLGLQSKHRNIVSLFTDLINHYLSYHCHAWQLCK